MRTFLFSILALGVLFSLKACSPAKQDDTIRAAKVQVAFHRDLSSLATDITALHEAIAQDKGEAVIQKAFIQARLHYKATEYLSEYSFPMVAKKLNGPALAKVEIEPDEITNLKPNGFQVVEELVFPYNQASKTEALEEVSYLQKLVSDLQQNEEATTLKDRQVFEAMRLQVVRILSLGISGFDSPVAFQSLPEASASLKAMQNALAFYADDLGSDKGKTDQAFQKAQDFLHKPENTFNNFDRLGFIRDTLTPLSEALFSAQQALNLQPADLLTPLKQDFTQVFTEKAFNPLGFAPNDAREIKPLQIMVGKLLFYDPILATDGSRSCATCHQNALAFTDGLPRANSIDGKPSALRNTPTLLNAALQRTTAYDFLTTHLEDRVEKVINSAPEMHSSPLEVAQKVRSIPEYAQMFEKAFGKSTDDKVLARQILVAISQYMRTLVGMNSPFDRYIRGENGATLDDSAKRGFNLFMGRAKCGTCHFAPLFNGTVPPSYAEAESEVLGVPEKPLTSGATISTDVGKFDLFKIDLHQHAFKTSTVRNAAKTAPYMHNGVYKTLDEVIDFYNRGGGAGIGIRLPNQTLPTNKLNLTDTEIQDLKAFIESLTDLSPVTAVPTHFPTIPAGSKAVRK